MVRVIARRLATVLRRKRHERELDAELAFHLQMLTEQNVAEGMAPEAARQAACRAFGRLDLIKEEVRETWLVRAWETMAQDVRYGIRSLRRAPGFAAIVIIAMALGIGANTAIFSVVNGVLLKPLPFEHGERLVALHQQQPLAGVDDLSFSALEVADYRTARSLDGVVEFHDMWFILLGLPSPERVSTGVVSAGFFDALGIRPLYGRTFGESDDRPGAPAVLVLSHAYWQRRFGGDPSVVGRTFRMNDRPHQVVGVLPPVPAYPREVDVYMPTSACPFRSNPEAQTTRSMRMVDAIGRVRPGVSVAKAQADLDLMSSQLQRDYPDEYPASRGYRVRAVPLRDELTQSFTTTLYVLLGTAAFVLLIVCASVANLMLARMVKREREIAIRGALGASRTRLTRQLLTESTLLSLAGGLLGLLLAHWGIDLLVLFVERFTTRASEIAIDRNVLAYTFIVSVATGVVFGSMPALNGHLTVSPALGSGARATDTRHRLRDGLIVLQIAASFMLLIGAGLTIRSLVNLQRVDPGFRTEDVLTFRIDLNFTKYDSPARRAQFWRQVAARLAAVPGVVSAGGAGTFPLNDQAPFAQSLVIQRRDGVDANERARVDVRLATPEYFATIGLPVVAGRGFRTDEIGGPGDSPDVPNGAVDGVVIVNQSLARHYWPGDEAIGKLMSGDGGRTWSRVVGVVADVRQQLRDPVRDEVYVPMFQSGQLSTTWLARTTESADAVQERIVSAVRELDPEQPVENFRTLEAVRAASLTSPKVTAALLAAFGLLALVITAAGIAGVIAFSVNQRTQEFGIRMALGAGRTSVLALVLRQGLQLVALGLSIGIAGALLLTQVLTSLLFDIQPNDGLTFAAVSLALLLVALASCLLPARRAASVDPIVALRTV